MSLALFLLMSQAAPEAAIASSRNCSSPASNEVVVCGVRKGQSPYRLQRLPEKYSQPKPPPRAEIEIAPGVTLSLNAETSELPGAQGVAAMLRLKIKF